MESKRCSACGCNFHPRPQNPHQGRRTMTDTTKVQLGQRIQLLRKRAKLKQEYVADQVGLDTKSLSRIEGGSRFPSMETLEKISVVLGVPLKAFFDFPEEPVPPEELRRYLSELADTLKDEQLPQVVGALRDLLQEK